MQMTLRYAHLAPSHKVAAISLLDGDPDQAAPKTIQKRYSRSFRGKSDRLSR